MDLGFIPRKALVMEPIHLLGNKRQKLRLSIESTTNNFIVVAFGASQFEFQPIVFKLLSGWARNSFAMSDYFELYLSMSVAAFAAYQSFGVIDRGNELHFQANLEGGSAKFEFSPANFHHAVNLVAMIGAVKCSHKWIHMQTSFPEHNSTVSIEARIVAMNPNTWNWKTETGKNSHIRRYSEMLFINLQFLVNSNWRIWAFSFQLQKFDCKHCYLKCQWIWGRESKKITQFDSKKCIYSILVWRSVTTDYCHIWQWIRSH